MADEDVVLRIRLEDQQRAQSGLRETADDVENIGKAADRSSRKFSGLDRSSRATGRTFTRMSAGARGVTGSVGMVAGGIGRMAATVGGVLALGAGFRTAFSEASDAARVGAQTNAVLKSTGGIAGITAGHVGNLATQISNYAGIDDEAIQSAENLLLTFTNVRNEAGKGNKIFDQTTVAATNMGVALGTDTSSAALMLGKALNDPAKGYSRLQRSGVSFSAGQIKQIKTMQKNNDLLGAQRIILGEVNKEFGGSAAAQAQPMDKLKVALSNVAEAVGTALLPSINKVLNPTARFINGITQGTGEGGRFADKVKVIGGQVMAVARGAFPTIKNAITSVVGIVQTAGPRVLAFGQQIVSAFTQALGPVRPVATAILLVGQRISQVAGYITRVMAPAFRSIAAVVGGTVRLVAQLIHGDFAGAWQSAKRIVVDAKDAIVNVVRGVTAPVRAVFSGLPDAIGDVASGFATLGGKIVDGVVSGITGGGKAVLDAIMSIIPGPLRGPLSSVLGIGGGDTPGVFKDAIAAAEAARGSGGPSAPTSGSTPAAAGSSPGKTSAAARAPRAVLPSALALPAPALGGGFTANLVLDGQVAATATGKADADWSDRQ